MVLAEVPSGGAELEGEQLRFGHLLYRETDTLAPQAGTLWPTEGHGVDPVVARITYDHPAILELLAQPEGQRQVVREDARLKPEVHGVGDLHGLPGRVEGDEDTHRPVDLLAVEACLLGNL